jgi:tetratricopeptide (TPR) repeat protein
MTSCTYDYIGRNKEVREFQKILATPHKKPRVMLLRGPGGIGKTWLVRRMLTEAEKNNHWVIRDVIDFHPTYYRTVDGIQARIKQLLEEFIASRGFLVPMCPFSDYEARPTPEVFHTCLERLCKEHPTILAFDTFERLDQSVRDWLLNDGYRGLQVPGLICVVASRPEDETSHPVETINPRSFLIKSIEVSGFDKGAIPDFYNLAKDKIRGTLDDYFQDSSGDEIVDWLWKRTKGHPLMLEIAINWADLLDKSLLVSSPVEYEKQIMEKLRDEGDLGRLNIRGKPVSKPVFDTFVCMSYINRRFDDSFLKFLVDEKFLELYDTESKRKMNFAEIIKKLEDYFFVKTRDENGKRVLQLHDEMARLVKEYVWGYWVGIMPNRHHLPEKIIGYYNKLIRETRSKDLRDSLEIEKLYYMLQSDVQGAKRLWFKLASQNRENVVKLLPGEIMKHIQEYDEAEQKEFYSKIADIQFNLRHIKAARESWNKVEELGKKFGNDGWVVDALLGKHNCTWQTDPRKSLSEYVEPAIALCESKVPCKLPKALYEKGFAYDQMLDINKAVEYYEKAKDAYGECDYCYLQKTSARMNDEIGYSAIDAVLRSALEG